MSPTQSSSVDPHRLMKVSKEKRQQSLPKSQRFLKWTWKDSMTEYNCNKPLQPQLATTATWPDCYSRRHDGMLLCWKWQHGLLQLLSCLFVDEPHFVPLTEYSVEILAAKSCFVSSEKNLTSTRSLHPDSWILQMTSKETSVWLKHQRGHLFNSIFLFSWSILSGIHLS